ncbi:preprotein translocase subunit SecE [Bacillaceae bacterium SIJ1]|uniref:preprotein translocase subunit SecE n=1 Tax=Litoribacterium kuwaitense TaxID=1398745 RepID=UPI0013ED15AB|nr:preprotein translocase subunit SecE [Litoribacterium kuwaitense]NGP45827.1 preprotein translocase subunit SecE [Litoribacterium kuwaitense]
MGKIIRFLREVVNEMKKVRWPKRNELFRYTVTVLVTVIFMTLFFTVTDLAISTVIDFVLAE